MSQEVVTQIYNYLNKLSYSHTTLMILIVSEIHFSTKGLNILKQRNNVDFFQLNRRY